MIVRKHLGTLVGVISAALLLGAPAHGRQSPAAVQFESAIDVMRIHVGVEDADGRFVPGLDASDFVLTIDGDQRRLVDALEVSDLVRADEQLLPEDPGAGTPAQLMASAVPAPRLPAAARRHFLIFFDLTISNIRSLRYTREAALDFVRNVALPSDVLGLAIYSPRRGLEVPVAFTTNHRRLEEVLEEVAPKDAIAGVDPGGNGLDTGERAAVASDNIRERFEPVGGMFNLAAMEAFANASGAERITRGAEDMMRGLALLMEAMAPEQGRKHVLFFSNGLPNEVFTRGRFRDEAADTIRSALGTDTVIHTFAPDSLTVANYDDVSRRVVEGDARTWDPLAERESAFDEREVLHFLPGETGGTATFYRSDLAAGLAQVEATTRSFYMLAFRMNEGDRDRVEIDVRTTRANTRIAWAPSELQLIGSRDQRTPLQSRLELASALESAGDRADLRMRLEAVPISVRNGYGRAAIVVQIEPRQVDALRVQRGDGRVEFEILGQAIDSTGAVRDYFRTRAELNVEGDPEGDSTPFRYFNMIVAPPGRYHVRVVVQEVGTGRIAAQRLQLDVPRDPDLALRMSGPVIVKSGTGIVNGMRFGEQPRHRDALPVAYPFQIMQRELVPDLTTMLTAGQRLELFALVHDLSAPDPEADPQAGIDAALRNSSGDLVFIERFGGVIWERNPEDGSMRLGVQLWLPDSLPSGAWELVFQITDLATFQSTDAGVDVTVLSGTP